MCFYLDHPAPARISQQKGSARHTESDDGIHDPEDPASPSNPDSESPHDPEDEEIVEVIEEDPEHKLGKLVQYLSQTFVFDTYLARTTR